MTFQFTTFDQAITAAHDFLVAEYRAIQTGRATPQVLDLVQVEQYGSRVPLPHCASISIEDPKTLRVAPWDKSLIRDMEKAINDADLGLSVSSDDGGLRVHFPQLTGETREKLVRVLKERLEEARVRVRAAREEANKEIEALAKQGEYGEDDKNRFKEEVQKRVDSANQKLEDRFKDKEKEVLGEN